MEHLIIITKLFATTLLIIIAIYSWMYFSRVEKIERQFGIYLPKLIRKTLTVLSIAPMALSLVIIFLVIVELGI